MRLASTLGIALLIAPSALAAPGMAVESTAYGSPAWSPYLVGAGIGVLTWITFALADKSVGASSFYATLAGMLGKLLAPAHTGRLKYFNDNPPSVDWRFIFILATIAGGFLAASTGGELRDEMLPQMWLDRFGRDHRTKFLHHLIMGEALDRPRIDLCESARHHRIRSWIKARRHRCFDSINDPSP